MGLNLDVRGQLISLQRVTYSSLGASSSSSDFSLSRTAGQTNASTQIGSDLTLFVGFESGFDPSQCSSLIRPSDLSSTNNIDSSVLLLWNSTPNSRGCQIRGGPSGGSISTLLTLGDTPNSFVIPKARLTTSTTYTWQVRCACKIAPLDATAFSEVDTFTTLSPRLADLSNSITSISAQAFYSLYAIDGRLLRYSEDRRPGLMRLVPGIYLLVTESLDASPPKTTEIIVLPY
jgi:hypothetical protein